MTFRVDTSGGDWRDRRAAILSAEAAAIAAGCALIWYSVHSAGRWLFLVALGEILFSVGYGTWVGFRAGVRVLKSQLQFDLTETELAASRAGHPTVRIELSKIDRIQESREWLTVCSLRPYRRIGIPVEVKGFATLKRRLGEFRTPTPARPNKHQVWALSGTAASGVMLLWSPNMEGAAAGAVGLVILSIYNTLRLRTRLRAARNSMPAILLAAANWLAVIALICFRLPAVW